MRKRMSVSAVVALLMVLMLPLSPASAGEGRSYQDVVDMTFPVPPEAVWEPSPHTWETKSTHFHYDANRGGGRKHQSVDLMVPYGTPVYAAMSGTISWMPFDRSYYMIRIDGDDGRVYDYVHLGHDNDPPSKAYASGLERGVHVERGQLLGWAGCSGSASCTSSGYHLHFSVEDPNIIDDPYWPNPHYDNPRLDPYPSLRDAWLRGDVPGNVGGSRFRDVRGGTHADNIERIAEAGITLGCGSGRYCPDAYVSRAEMATFLARAIGLEGRPESFEDVSGGAHAPSIGAVAEAGISVGCREAFYCPDDPVTRAQMGTFLARALELAPAEGNRFSDVPTNWVHTPSINSIAEFGVTNGCATGLYCPDAYVTRAQMASFLARAFLDGA